MTGSHPQPINPARLKWDLSRRKPGGQYEAFFAERNRMPAELFQGDLPIWLEVGAGTGKFFAELAARHPEARLIAIERCRERAHRLVRKAARSGLPNFHGLRGNVIPTLMHGIPTESLDRIYILYPCPWLKTSQRKNRWYLHPVMPHLLRILRPGGLLIWASDQKFYIDEARYVCDSVYQLPVLSHGELSPNPWNDLALFPEGRTKFEATFRAEGNPCHELIVSKR